MKEGINAEFVVKDPDLPSGVALITVDAAGENCIVVAPGANGNLMPPDIPDTVFTPGKHDILLLQLEIPLETVIHSAGRACKNGLKVILNPAPAQKLPDKLLENLWMITPNETEAEILAGITVSGPETAAKAADILMKRGVKNVIITLGEAGAYARTEMFEGMVPGVKVEAVDTTAAGDVFNGALAVALSEKMKMKDAVEFACRAAALSVTRMGAQASAPYRNEIA
jgi:ribokinase